MDSAEKKPKLLLGGALIATLIAVVLVGEGDEETVINTVEPVQSAKSSVDKTKAQENNSEYLDISKLGQRKFNPSAGELCASSTWTPQAASRQFGRASGLSGVLCMNSRRSQVCVKM